MSNMFGSEVGYVNVISNESSLGGGADITATTDITCSDIVCDSLTTNTEIVLNNIEIKDNFVNLSYGNPDDLVSQGLLFESTIGVTTNHSGLCRAPNGRMYLIHDTDTVITGATDVSILPRGYLTIETLVMSNIEPASATMTNIGTQDSSNMNTGSMVLNGGLGVKKNLYGNFISAQNASFTNGQDAIATNSASVIVLGGLATGKTILCGGTTDTSETSAGALIVSGGVGIAKGLAVGGISSFVNSTDSASTYSGSLVVSGGVAVQKSLYVGNKLRSTLNSNSTDTLTGALTVSGGVGIGNNLNVGGIMKANLTTNSTDTLTGSLLVSGGAGISKDLVVGGSIKIINTTVASTTLTGALIITGGASVGGTLQVGGNIQMQGDGSLFMGNTGGSYIDRFGNQYAQSGATTSSFYSYFTNATGGTGNGFGAPVFRWYNNIARSPSIEYLSTVDSTSASTGACVVGGGFGVGKKMYVGTGVYLPTTGGTASSLNYYEEYTHTTDIAGCYASSNFNFYITRIGRIVTMHYSTLTGTYSVGQPLNASTALPTRFRPSATATSMVHGQNNGSQLTCTLIVYADGTIYFYNGVAPPSPFTAGTCGWYAGTICWSM